MNMENISLIRFGELEIERRVFNEDNWNLRNTISGISLSLTTHELEVLYDVLKTVLGREHEGCRSIK